MRVNSALVTGFGATVLTGPESDVVVQHVLNRAHDIAHRDPGPPLASVAQSASQAQAKWSQHFRQGAAVRAHHYSNAHLRGADSRLSRGLRGGFPLTAYFRGKALTRRAVLAQDLIAAIAVETDGGS